MDTTSCQTESSLSDVPPEIVYQIFFSSLRRIFLFTAKPLKAPGKDKKVLENDSVIYLAFAL